MLDTNINAKSKMTLPVFDFVNSVTDRQICENYVTQMVTVLRTKQGDVKRYNIATKTLFKLEDIIHCDIGTYSFSMMLSNLLHYQINQLNHHNLLQISYRRTFTLQNEADLKQLL